MAGAAGKVLPIEGLIEGKMVHYVDAEKRHHAAVVIEVFDLEAGYISMRSLYDLKTYVGTWSFRQEVYTWHWFDEGRE